MIKASPRALTRASARPVSRTGLATTPNHGQQTAGACSAFRVREIRFRPAAHGSGHHTPAAPDFHDAEFVAVAGGEEELHAVDQLSVPLPAQVLDVEVALRIDFD